MSVKVSSISEAETTLVQMLKEGNINYPLKEQCFSLIDKEISTNSKLTLLYNLYEYPNLNFTNDQKYFIYQLLKGSNYIPNFQTIEYYYLTSEITNFSDLLVLLLHNNGYKSVNFPKNTYIAQIIALFNEISSQDTDISIVNEYIANKNVTSQTLELIIIKNVFYGYNYKKNIVSTYPDPMSPNDFANKLKFTFHSSILFPSYNPELIDIPWFEKSNEFTIVWHIFGDFDVPSKYRTDSTNQISLYVNEMKTNPGSFQFMYNLLQTYVTDNFKARLQIFDNNPFLETLNKPVWGTSCDVIKRYENIDIKSIIKWTSETTQNSFSFLYPVLFYSYGLYLIEKAQNPLNHQAKALLENMIQTSNKDEAMEKLQRNLITSLPLEFLVPGKLFEKVFRCNELSNTMVDELVNIFNCYPHDMVLVMPQINAKTFVRFIATFCKWINKKNGYDLKQLEKIETFSQLQQFVEKKPIKQVDNDQLNEFMRFCTEMETKKNFVIPFDLSMNSAVYKVLESNGFTFDQIFVFKQWLAKSTANSIPIISLYINTIMSINVVENGKMINQNLSQIKYISDDMKLILMRYVSGNQSDMQAIFAKLNEITSFAASQNLSDCVDAFIEKYIEKLLNISNLSREFYQVAYQKRVNDISFLKEEALQICSKVSQSNKANLKISLSKSFAGLLNNFLVDIQPPMKKDSDKVKFDILPQTLATILKDTIPYLEFDKSEQLVNHELVFLNVPTFTIRNKIAGTFFRYHRRDDLFFFKFDSKFSRKKFTWEGVEPEFFEISLPSTKITSYKSEAELKSLSKKLIELEKTGFSEENLVEEVTSAIKIITQTKGSQVDKSKLEYILDKLKQLEKIKDKVLNVDFEKKITCLANSVTNICDKLYDNGQKYLFLYSINSQIASNFSYIDLTIPDVMTMQTRPLEILIYTNTNDIDVALEGPKGAFIGICDYQIRICIPFEKFDIGEQMVDYIMIVEGNRFPIHVDFNKIRTKVFLKVEGNSLFYNKSTKMFTFNKKPMFKDQPLQITTFGGKYNRIHHKITFSNDDKIPNVQYNELQKKSNIFFESNVNTTMCVKVGDNTSFNIDICNDVFSQQFTILYFNRFTQKIEAIPDELFCGLLGFRHYFFVGAALSDPKDRIIADYVQNDLLLIKEMKYLDDVVSFDICFSKYTFEDTEFTLIITSEKNEFKKVFKFDIINVHLDFHIEDDQICFECLVPECEDHPYLYYTSDKQWRPIKPKEYIPIPEFKFIVVSPITYEWMETDDEYNVETFVDFSIPTIIPPEITNYCYFAIAGDNYKIVMEDEFDSSKMKIVAKRLCDQPYDPNEGYDKWHNVWVPMSEKLDYLHGIFKPIKNIDKLYSIVEKLFSFLRVGKEKLHKKTKDKRTKDVIIATIFDVFSHRLKNIKYTKYGLRLPIKIEDMFSAQKLMTSAIQFNPIKIGDFQKKYTKLNNAVKNYPTTIVKDSVNALILVDKNPPNKYEVNSIKEKPPAALEYGFGNEICKLDENVDDLVIPDLENDCEFDFSIYLNKCADLCFKLPALVKKSSDFTNSNALKIFSFLNSLNIEISVNKEKIDESATKLFTAAFKQLKINLSQNEQTEESIYCVRTPEMIHINVENENERTVYAKLPNEKKKETKQPPVQKQKIVAPNSQNSSPKQEQKEEKKLEPQEVQNSSVVNQQPPRFQFMQPQFQFQQMSMMPGMIGMPMQFGQTPGTFQMMGIQQPAFQNQFMQVPQGFYPPLGFMQMPLQMQNQMIQPQQQTQQTATTNAPTTSLNPTPRLDPTLIKNTQKMISQSSSNPQIAVQAQNVQQQMPANSQNVQQTQNIQQIQAIVQQMPPNTQNIQQMQANVQYHQPPAEMMNMHPNMPPQLQTIVQPQMQYGMNQVMQTQNPQQPQMTQQFGIGQMNSAQNSQQQIIQNQNQNQFGMNQMNSAQNLQQQQTMQNQNQQFGMNQMMQNQISQQMQQFGTGQTMQQGVASPYQQQMIGQQNQAMMMQQIFSNTAVGQDQDQLRLQQQLQHEYQSQLSQHFGFGFPSQ